MHKSIPEIILVDGNNFCKISEKEKKTIANSVIGNRSYTNIPRTFYSCNKRAYKHYGLGWVNNMRGMRLS